MELIFEVWKLEKDESGKIIGGNSALTINNVHNSEVNSIVILDKNVFLSAAYVTVKIWRFDIKNNKSECILSVEHNINASVHPLINSKFLAIAGSDTSIKGDNGIIRFSKIERNQDDWQISGYKENLVEVRCDGGVISLIELNDYGLIASGSNDWKVRIWQLDFGNDVITGCKLMLAIEVFTQNISALSVSYDKKFLIAASWDDMIRIYGNLTSITTF